MTTPHPPEAHGEQTRRIAGYEILSKLGQGGMGAVYKAKQLSLDRLVALKVLPRQLTSSQDFIQRFSREARVTGQLNHPNIIKVFDVGRSNTGICYYSMEYVEGENLRSVLDREKRLGTGTVLKVLEEMASALAHAHKHGIIHRDIKPDNILIDKEGASKLADLGLAKVAEDASATAAAKGGAYASMAGQVVGTPYYMSPEQAEGITVDTRSDLYSLGATAFHLLAGAPPFTAETPMGVITKHLTESVPSIRARVPGVPVQVDALLRRLMAKLPAERFQTPAELLAEVSRIRHELAAHPATPPPRPAPPAASRTPLFVGGGVLLAALAVTAFAMRGKGSVAPPPAIHATVPSSDPKYEVQRKANEALHAAMGTSGAEKLRLMRRVAEEYKDTPPGQLAQKQVQEILDQHWNEAMRTLESLKADREYPRALALLAGLSDLPEARRSEIPGLRAGIEAAMSAATPPPPAPVPVPVPVPPAPPPAPRLRTAEIAAGLDGIRKESRAHAWEKALELAGTLQKELGPEMQPGDLSTLTALQGRASRNAALARRWTFEEGPEGWTPGPALPWTDGKAREASGEMGVRERALRFGSAGPGGRWSGEVRSPPFALQGDARLSVRWTLSLFAGRGRAPRGSKAYACLRDDKGRMVGKPLRMHPLREDWRDGKRQVTLNFAAEPLSAPAGREAEVRLCFGFCTNEPPGFSAAMLLDDIEVFYGEDAP